MRHRVVSGGRAYVTRYYPTRPSSHWDVEFHRRENDDDGIETWDVWLRGKPLAGACLVEDDNGGWYVYGVYDIGSDEGYLPSMEQKEAMRLVAEFLVESGIISCMGRK